MANDELVRILREGVDTWNRWRRENGLRPTLNHGNLGFAKFSHINLINFQGVDLSGKDLREVDFRFADLRDADLSESNLCGADLSDANLSGASLNSANLSGADLSDANLSHADLSEANLTRVHMNGTNLSGADLGFATLDRANFTFANLSGANLRRASLQMTTLGSCDFRCVKGLDSVEHWGPSTLGLDTIYRSEGRIPEGFLRGCGVPESFILQMRALIGAEEGMQFHSCFISYSHKDEEFAKRLHERMQDANLRVWYAPEDMKGGGKIHEQIEAQINVHDKLLLVLSEHSMASEWVATEIYHTRQREKKEGRQILFPIRLCPFERIREWKCFDADTGKDMAREIREYLIPDFANWTDHVQFEASFGKLLRDLRN